MKEEKQLEKKEKAFEGITNTLNSLYNKIQHFQEPEKDENQEFVEIIKRAREEWEGAEKTFHSVSDPDLIDYAIYNVEATRAKYIYLLKRAKEMGIKTNFY
ncbi:YaaL family protein [Natronincola ferrireducens]|nr:YaaL family protein [Natronincola ferrireducens]